LGSALTLVRRLLVREFPFTRELLVASSREFEAASDSEFDVTTTFCNNHASPSIDEIVQTEFDHEKEQELYNDFEKILQEQGANEVPPLPHVFGSNQYSEIQISPETAENSSLAVVSEFGWSQLAETSTSPSRAQPGVIDTGEELAQLVAAEDPSVALVSNLSWPDFNNKKQPTAVDKTWMLPVEDNCEQLLKLVAAEDPSVTLVSEHAWPDTSVGNNINHSSQTVTLTLPVVSATSLEQLRGEQPLDDTLLAIAVEATSSLEANNSSLGTNNSLTTNTTSCPELQVTNYPGRPIIEVAKSRPSVIVSTRSRKRAFIETDGNAEKKLIIEKDASVPIQTTPKPTLDFAKDDNQDEVPLAVLEKRRKGNARCKKYRINKKQKEATEETELEMLTRRNEFLKAEEKRLTDRKRKVQQSYLSLIRQKKIRFQ